MVHSKCTRWMNDPPKCPKEKVDWMEPDPRESNNLSRKELLLLWPLDLLQVPGLLLQILEDSPQPLAGSFFLS